MSSFNGRKLKIEIFGASHAEKIGVKVSGFPDFKIDKNGLDAFLDRRKSKNDAYSTPRKEKDEVVFSGLTGDSIRGDFTAEIINSDIKSSAYSDLYGKPRPSHADYAWHLKDGTLDFTGGGRFSGRMTAPFCVIGGICKQFLKEKGVKVEAYVSKVGKIAARSYKGGDIALSEILALREGVFPSLDKKAEILSEIEKAKKKGDSLGGVIECCVFGFPVGVGDDTFSGLEGKISSLVFSVPAVKGVEFGSGFTGAENFGSEENDNLYYKDGKVAFLSNNSGGINGGISNGNVITLSAAIKPTPSISLPQKTVDLVNKTDTEISIKGRHDACIVPRAVPVIESAVAIALVDEIL